MSNPTICFFILISTFCPVFGQGVEIVLPGGWSATETTSFFSSDKYAVILEREQDNSQQIDIALLVKSPDIKANDDFLIFKDKPKLQYGLIVDWYTNSFYLGYEKGESFFDTDFNLTRYRYSNNEWDTLDMSNVLDPNYTIWYSNMKDVNSSSTFILPLHLESSSSPTKPFGAGLLSIYKDEGDDLNTVFQVSGSTQNGLLGQNYDSSDNMEIIVFSEESDLLSQSEQKGRIITIGKKDAEYVVLDTIKNDLEEIQFGHTLQLYDRYLYVASSQVLYDELPWAYQLDRYSRDNETWVYDKTISSFKSSTLSGGKYFSGKEKYIDIEGSTIAYYTFDDSNMNINIARIENDGTLSKVKTLFTTSHDSKILPSIDLSKDGTELLVSGIKRNSFELYSLIFSLNFTNTVSLNDPQITVTQNPFSSFLRVTTEMSIKDMFLVNNIGQVVAKSYSARLDNLEFLSPGSYFLKVNLTNGFSRTLKVVKM